MKPIVIWDMGGILYRYFTQMLIDVGRVQGWPLDLMPLGPTHHVPDPDYYAMDRGEMTEPEYLARCVAMLLKHGIDFDPPTDLDWSDEFRKETWKLIDELHRDGHRQALLTNDATKWLGEEWWNKWDRIHYFEQVVDVKSIGIRKPAPEPYLACIESMQANPSDCVFIDDMHANCEGSEAVGMASIWFDITDPKASLTRLRRYLDVTIPEVVDAGHGCAFDR